MPTRKPEDMPKTGKVICFDVGKKTLGVSLSDRSRMIASPGKTLIRKKWSFDKEEIRKIIDAEKVTCAVVGLPLSMEGSVTPQTKSCYSFAELLEGEFGFPVLLWDERLTTVAAESALFEQRTGRQTRASKKDVKAQVDSVAASLILDGALRAIKISG